MDVSGAAAAKERATIGAGFTNVRRFRINILSGGRAFLFNVFLRENAF